MTLGELELIRIKTLKKIAKSKKSDHIAWLLIFIVCLIIGAIIFLWIFAISKAKYPKYMAAKIIDIL